MLPIRTLNSLTLLLPTTSILNLFTPMLPIKLHHFTPHNLKCEDEECGDFMPWLRKKSGIQISSPLSIGKSKHGRSLFACNHIQAGDRLLEVPYSVQISPDDVLPQVKCLLEDNVGNVARLAVVILTEQKKAQDSEWAPYISCLPQIGKLHSTIFWSREELEMIQPSSVYQETLNQEVQITNDHITLKPVLDSFPELFKDVTLENFRHAYSLVASRAWGSTKGVSLIPFADFLNHDGTSESVVWNNDDKQISEVIADRNYIQGDEVLICYGRFPNSTLLLDFGFAVPHNIHDQVCIRVDIPCHDHLRTMKLDLLQKHCLPRIKDGSFSSSGGSFLIKKVRSCSGKGKGIPQSLRAFARVLCCNTPEELTELAVEAAQHDGRLARRPLINRSMEIQAHETLLSLINELIDEYNFSIKSLLARESTNCKKHALRQLMAFDLLSGEVQVLRSAASWLENYCHSRRESTAAMIYPGELRNTVLKMNDE